MTSIESVRPTMEGSAGPATTRVTSRSGRVRGGAPNVCRGTLNWVSRAVGPASAARPQAARPRSAGCPQAATKSTAATNGVRFGMPEDNPGTTEHGHAGSARPGQRCQRAAEVGASRSLESPAERRGLEQRIPPQKRLEYARATLAVRGFRDPGVFGPDATVVAVELLDRPA